MTTDRNYRSRSIVLLFATSALVAFGAAGCPGDLEPSEIDPGNPGAAKMCGDVVADIIVPRCASAGCHDTTSQQAGLDLLAPDLGMRLAGQPANSPGCSGPLVVPGDPEASVLFVKTGDAPPCGGRMPLLAAPLTDEETTCLADWIIGL